MNAAHKLKKTLVVWLLFLTGCGLSPKPLPLSTFTPVPLPQPSLSLTPRPLLTRTPIATHIFRDDDLATIQVFKTSENCPNICWRGIHAGTTSAGQAVALLKNSKKEMGEVEIFDDYILGIFGVIRFSKGIITSIDLTPGGAVHVTLGDFLSLMGEPDGIVHFNRNCFVATHITFFLTWECPKYTLYYSELSAVVFFSPSRSVNTFGLSPNDVVWGLTVGIPLGNDERYLGPWLGYGHLEEYSLNPAPTFTLFPLPLS